MGAMVTVDAALMRRPRGVDVRGRAAGSMVSLMDAGSGWEGRRGDGVDEVVGRRS